MHQMRKLFEEYGLGECTDEMIERYSVINRKYWEKLERGELTKSEILVGRFQEFFQEECIVFDKAEEFNEKYQLKPILPICSAILVFYSKIIKKTMDKLMIISCEHNKITTFAI